MTNPINIIDKSAFDKANKIPNQENIWDSIANPWKHYVVKKIPIILEFLKGKKGKVADLGCGTGRNMIFNKSLEYFGVDFSAVQLKHAAELIKKEIAVETGSGDAGKYKVGNISFERIVSIAKTKMPNLLAKDLRSAVRLIVGTCVSLGVLVDSKSAKDVEKDILAGVYDKEIKEEITEPTAEKKQKLDEFFANLKAKQEKEKKALEEAKAAEEAAKAAAAAAAPAAAPGAPVAAAPGAAPAAAGAKPGAPAAPEAAKKEEKPAKKK